MTTREAIALIARQLEDEIVVCTTGYTCRDMQACGDRPENFYMIGSMGLAAPLGLGIALCKPDRAVVVLDGDGAVLMGLGTLPMIGALRPQRLIHVVLDNQVYASTGNQPTYAEKIRLEGVAAVSGYPVVRRVDTLESLMYAWEQVRSSSGPVFLLVKCSPDFGPPKERVRLAPEEITARLKGRMDAS